MCVRERERKRRGRERERGDRKERKRNAIQKDAMYKQVNLNVNKKETTV